MGLSGRIAPARELVGCSLQKATIKLRGYHRKYPFKPDHATKHRGGLVGPLKRGDVGA
jgi:hypothetical protein